MPAAQTPILRRLLARADRVSLPLQESSQSSFEDGLARLFGLGAADMPWGALGAWGETGEQPRGFVLRLDPVHFKLGMTEAIVLGGAALHLSMDEANTLARALEQHFSARAWRIEVAAPQRWYLHLPEPSDLVTAPLAQALIFGAFAATSVGLYMRFFRSREPQTDRPLLNKRAAQLIGREIALTEAISMGRAKVQIGDALWTLEGPDLPVGTRVRVIATDGIVLRVQAE